MRNPLGVSRAASPAAAPRRFPARQRAQVAGTGAPGAAPAAWVARPPGSKLPTRLACGLSMCSQRRGEDHQPSSFGHTRASCTACGDCRRTEMPRVRPRVRPRALPWCAAVPRGRGPAMWNALPAGDTRVLVQASSVLDNRHPRADQHSSPSPSGSAGKRGRPPAAAQQPRLPATNLSAGFCLSLSLSVLCPTPQLAITPQQSVIRPQRCSKAVASACRGACGLSKLRP